MRERPVPANRHRRVGRIAATLAVAAFGDGRGRGRRKRPVYGRKAVLGLAVFALVVAGGGSASFAGRARKGGYGGAVANPGGPYTVKRGGKVTLDGSGSTPRSFYKWTFASHCPDDVEGRPSVLRGKKVTIVAVCNTTATLTVTRRPYVATKSTKIRVTGRLRDVPYDQDPAAETRNFPFDIALGTFVFGFNRDQNAWERSHDPDLSDHWLERPHDGNVVETKKVSDPGGPYDGFHYVTDHNLKVKRQIILNKKLLPDGPVYALNKARHKRAIENIDEATLDHERIHGQLVEQALKSKRLKFLDQLARAVGTSEEGLQARADVIVGDGETELKNASSESKVQSKMAKKWHDQKATILRPNCAGTLPGPGLGCPADFQHHSPPESQTYTLAKIGDKEVATR